MRNRLMGIVLVLALAFPAMAQEKKKSEAPPEDRSSYEAAVIPVKTLRGDAFQRLVALLGAFKVDYRADESLRTIVVFAPKPVVENMRRVVAELDRPGSEAAIGRNIDMNLTFLRCSVKPPTEGSGTPIPADLEGVAKQLRATTPYKHIEVWDALPIRAQEGKEAQQTTPLPMSTSTQGMRPTVRVIAKPSSVTQKGSVRFVRFDRLALFFRIPYTTGPSNMASVQVMDAGIDTSGDFKEGQKVVIGKVADTEATIFVVVELKVLD